MKKISDSIHLGAMAFLKAEYSILFVFVAFSSYSSFFWI